MRGSQDIFWSRSGVAKLKGSRDMSKKLFLRKCPGFSQLWPPLARFPNHLGIDSPLGKLSRNSFRVDWTRVWIFRTTPGRDIGQNTKFPVSGNSGIFPGRVPGEKIGSEMMHQVTKYEVSKSSGSKVIGLPLFQLWAALGGPKWGLGAHLSVSVRGKNRATG
jgi:hypothetical protein